MQILKKIISSRQLEEMNEKVQCKEGALTERIKSRRVDYSAVKQRLCAIFADPQTAIVSTEIIKKDALQRTEETRANQRGYLASELSTSASAREQSLPKTTACHHGR